MPHAFQRLKNATEYVYERMQEEFENDFASNIYHFCKMNELDAYENLLFKIMAGDNSDATREAFYAIARNNYALALERYNEKNYEKTEKALIREYETNRAEAMID